MSTTSSVQRKGRGSQVFTQEMACALVEMYHERKKDFPGSGYSLPPESFEAIASELRAKFNVTPTEIDQQTLKKKLSNIRTRVRNRCRDMRPEADLSALNLTPSEKIYFRYFGPPTGGDNRGDSGSSTPLPNGLNENNASGVQNSTIEQNGHSPHENNVASKADGPIIAQPPQPAAQSVAPALNDAATIQLMRIYAENLPLFTPQAVGMKNLEAQRSAVYETISKHLMHAFHVSLDPIQISLKIEGVIRSLAQKVDDFRRVSGLENENDIVLRPPNLNAAESELFDAQFQESPETRKSPFANNSPASPPTSSALLLQPTSQVQPSVSSDNLSQQNVVMVENELYYVSSANGSIPVTSTAVSMPLLTLTTPTESTSEPNGPSLSLQPPTSGLTVNALNGPTTSSAATTPIAPSSLASPISNDASRRNNQRKNNKRKISPSTLTDEEMDRRLQETIEAVTSAPKKSKVTNEEKRSALMALEKQRTLRAQRQLAEEELVLVRNQLKLAEEQTSFYRIWTEIGNRIRGFLRP
ncbi:hypothetical protein M3Y94_00710400 [Aphelenchoides besseyi]|nr:hypothetical protein M3Y94_00710400 [Aphelenchoides besseyi]KAI6231702.1 hypothetical protein M3Y95_00409600 [Aphelenchoides besseyi]